MDYVKQLEVTNSLLEDKLEKVTKEFYEFRNKLYSNNKETSNLIEASRYGHLEAVKFHIEGGADVHAESDLALRWASSKGHLETVKYLLSNGADVHAESDYALRWASSNGHLETVKFLLSNGADVHAESDLALRYASSKGHKEVVEFLESIMKKEL